MPSVRIPLVGGINQRGFNSGADYAATKDQKFTGCFFSVIVNSVTQSATAYVEKRPGVIAIETPASGEENVGVYYGDQGAGLFAISVFDANPGSTFYQGTTSIGTSASGSFYPFITEATFGSNTTYLFAPANNISSGTTFYYNHTTASQGGSTFTADTSSGSAVLSNVSSTTGLVVGQKLSGTGIAATARIQSIDSSSQVTMTANATATNSTVTITRERISLILNPTFSSTCGRFVELHGRAYILGRNDSNIYASDINDPQTWTSGNFIKADEKNDFPVGLEKYRGLIACFSRDSIEFFYDAGNPSGSQLSKANQFSHVGALVVTGTQTAAWNVTKCLGDDLFWIGSDFAVYRMDGFSPKPVSSRSVNAILSSTQGANGPRLDGFIYQGRPYLYIQCDNGSGTTAQLIYDVQLDLWGDPGFPFLANIHGAGNKVILGSSSTTTGKTYNLDYSPTISYLDDGSAFTMDIRLARQDLGTGNRKFLKSIELVADTQASGTTTLQISKDDGATWETIGTFDMTKAKKIIYRCGSFNGGAQLRLTHSADTPWRGEALIVEYDVGSH